MPEDDYARVVVAAPLQLVGELVRGHDALRKHYYRMRFAVLLRVMYLLYYRFYICGNLRHKHELRAAGHRRFEREEARVAAHDLDDEHTVVARRRVAQLADALERRVAGGVEAYRAVRPRHVVVNRPRHADDLDAALVKLERAVERSVAANNDERVYVVLLQLRNARVDAFGAHELRTSRGAQYRAAVHEYASDGAARHRHEVAVEQPFVAAPDSDNLKPVI